MDRLPSQRKKPKTQPAKSEEVEPQAPSEKLSDAVALLLKDAGTARTTSITLAGLEYADHLGKAMEDHADKVEKVYKEVQQALKTKNEKEIMKWIQKVETESANTKKLQARKMTLFSSFFDHAAQSLSTMNFLLSRFGRYSPAPFGTSSTGRLLRMPSCPIPRRESQRRETRKGPMRRRVLLQRMIPSDSI